MEDSQDKKIAKLQDLIKEIQEFCGDQCILIPIWYKLYKWLTRHLIGYFEENGNHGDVIR
jgi:hypothetical protein